jgi:hypothetical protein
VKECASACESKMSIVLQYDAVVLIIILESLSCRQRLLTLPEEFWRGHKVKGLAKGKFQLRLAGGKRKLEGKAFWVMLGGKACRTQRKGASQLLTLNSLHMAEDRKCQIMKA